MTPTCSHIRRRLDASLDLDAGERRAFRDHARACDACRAELETTLRVLERLEPSRAGYRALRYDGALPAEVVGVLRGRKRAGGRFSEALIRRFPLFRPLPAALAGAACVLALLFFFETRRPAGSAPSAGEPPVTIAQIQDRPGPRTPPRTPAVQPATPAQPGAETRPRARAQTWTETPMRAQPGAETPMRAETPTAAELDPGYPKIRPVSASRSLRAIRDEARALGPPSTPRRPAGLVFRAPPRPAPPPPDRS